MPILMCGVGNCPSGEMSVWGIVRLPSKLDRDHYLGRYYIFGHGYKKKTACIRGHVYFLNIIAVYQLRTIGNTRSIVKEADPKNGGFP